MRLSVLAFSSTLALALPLVVSFTLRFLFTFVDLTYAAIIDEVAPRLRRTSLCGMSGEASPLMRGGTW